VSGAEEPGETGIEDAMSNMKLDNENELSSNSLDENSKDSELFSARNTGDDQHEVQLPNKESSIEDNKQALEAQHEKQTQDTNITATEIDRIDEAGKEPTQTEGPITMLMDMEQNKQDGTPEKAAQVLTNSDTTEKNGMDLEDLTQKITNEIQKTILVRDEL
ncbi:7660_t:CDS:2, partial [Gigaspora rosea]